VDVAGVAMKQPREVSNHHHFSKAVKFSLSETKEAMSEVKGFNAKLAILITNSVGTMACAYIFSILALISLPAILIQAGVLTNNNVPHFLTKPGLILIIAWIAQTFLQLVLLSVIMVGQNVQSLASDARAEKTFNDTEAVLDALNIKTAGGLKVILDEIKKLNSATK
jgi:hypothetical protein